MPQQSVDDFITIAQAANKLKVTRQRMHQLIDEYSLKTREVNKRLKLIDKTELTKIPAYRPPGPKKK